MRLLFVKHPLGAAHEVQLASTRSALAGWHSRKGLTNLLKHTPTFAGREYPGEAEILWIACSFMQPLHKEDMHFTEQGRPVSLIHVKVNTSGKAMVVEESEERSKKEVSSMLRTVHSDLIWETKQRYEEDAFHQKLSLAAHWN